MGPAYAAPSKVASVLDEATVAESERDVTHAVVSYEKVATDYEESEVELCALDADETS